MLCLPKLISPIQWLTPTQTPNLALTPWQKFSCAEKREGGLVLMAKFGHKLHMKRELGLLFDYDKTFPAFMIET